MYYTIMQNIITWDLLYSNVPALLVCFFSYSMVQNSYWSTGPFMVCSIEGYTIYRHRWNICMWILLLQIQICQIMKNVLYATGISPSGYMVSYVLKIGGRYALVFRRRLGTHFHLRVRNTQDLLSEWC